MRSNGKQINGDKVMTKEIQEKLKSLNITAPTSVQQNVIPKILENKN